VSGLPFCEITCRPACLRLDTAFDTKFVSKIIFDLKCRGARDANELRLLPSEQLHRIHGVLPVIGLVGYPFMLTLTRKEVEANSELCAVP